MNGTIRFAGRLTLMRLLIHSFLLRSQSREYADRMDTYFAEIANPELREKLVSLRTRLGLAIVRHILITSPVVWSLLPILLVLLLAMVCITGVKQAQAEILALRV